MIPVKLFQRLTDYEEEYINNPTYDNYNRVTKFQSEIDWPYKASQDQLDYWNKFNHDPDYICDGCYDIRGLTASEHKCHSWSIMGHKVSDYFIWHGEKINGLCNCPLCKPK